MRRKGGAPRGNLEPYCLPKEQDGAVVRWIPNVQRPPFPYEDEKMDCSVGLNDFVDDRRLAYLSKQLQIDMCYGCLTPTGTKGGNRAKTYVTTCAYCWFPLCWTCQRAGKTSVGNDCCGICYFDSVSLQRKKKWIILSSSTKIHTSKSNNNLFQFKKYLIHFFILF